MGSAGPLHFIKTTFISYYRLHEAFDFKVALHVVIGFLPSRSRE